jgi:hypothetical protein
VCYGAVWCVYGVSMVLYDVSMVCLWCCMVCLWCDQSEFIAVVMVPMVLISGMSQMLLFDSRDCV